MCMSTRLTEVTFKDAVRSYVELHDEILQCQKGMRDLRKKKKELSDSIIEFMRHNQIDEFQIPDGKLQRRKQSRKEGMKNEYIVNSLKSSLGEERAVAMLEMINSQRNVVQTDSLRRTRKAED